MQVAEEYIVCHLLCKKETTSPVCVCARTHVRPPVYMYTLLHCAGLCRYCIFYKLKVGGNPAVSKSIFQKYYLLIKVCRFWGDQRLSHT